eukprot:UC1_evm1s436
MLLLRQGSVVDNYEGRRTEDALRGYIARQMASSSRGGSGATAPIVLSDSSFSTGVAHGFTAVRFFRGAGHALEAPLRALANAGGTTISQQQVRIAEVDCTRSAATCRRYPETAMGSALILMRSGGVPVSTYTPEDVTTPPSMEGLAAWIDASTTAAAAAAAAPTTTVRPKNAAHRRVREE